MLTKQETIERFCELQRKVAEVQGWKYAADCFCGADPFLPALDYQNQGMALEFIEAVIEAAVQEKLARED